MLASRLNAHDEKLRVRPSPHPYLDRACTDLFHAGANTHLHCANAKNVHDIVCFVSGVGRLEVSSDCSPATLDVRKSARCVLHVGQRLMNMRDSYDERLEGTKTGSAEAIRISSVRRLGDFPFLWGRQ